jgi:Methyltransferase FkbM domain
MSINAHAELNELVRIDRPAGATETVSCVTLDDSMLKYGWLDIDFIKIDAEGEETNILSAATRFLTAESPLIQYEIKVGSNINLDLVERFAALGYESYRLVPGIDLLAPFQLEDASDDYLLNVFCCKPDRAARLVAQGFLVQAGANASAARLGELSRFSDSSDTHGWRTALAGLPYGALLAAEWTQHMARNESPAVEQSLFHYALSRDTSLQPSERFAALAASYEGFKRICASQPTRTRLSSLARVAADYGARSVAVRTLEQLGKSLVQDDGQVDTSEPFLAPGARFDTVSPGAREDVPRWITAAALEEFERNRYLSSFYAGNSGKWLLEMIRKLGFGSEEMKRRLALVEKRFGSVP